jgi:hypothetical protein
MGSRRFVGLTASAAVLAVALTGCTSSVSLTGSASVSDAAAVAIGRQALGSKSPSTGAATASPTLAGCPASLIQGLKSGLPATATLTTLDPATVDGVLSDPEVSAGFVPSCAFSITGSGTSIDELYFLDMSATDQDAITNRLQEAGFVPGAPTAITFGTQQIYASSTARIEVAKVSVGGVSALLVAG